MSRRKPWSHSEAAVWIHPLEAFRILKEVFEAEEFNATPWSVTDAELLERAAARIRKTTPKKRVKQLA